MVASQQHSEKTIRVHFCEGKLVSSDNRHPSSPAESVPNQRKLLAGLISVVLIGFAVWQVLPKMEHWVSQNEQAFTQWLKPEMLQGLGWLLLPISFFGGLISSLSPCILALLPLNLSYIGSVNARSKTQATVQASAFVFGVVFTLSLFGLFSGFAGAVIVEYKGYIHASVGLVSIALAMGMLGMFSLPVPNLVSKMPQGAGPFVMGTTFALVTSPCASPVLLALLLAAGSTGNIILSSLSMASYALGYAAILFIGSLMAGFAKQVAMLRQHAVQMTRLGSYMLILIGLYYLYTGLRWLMA